MLLQRGAPLSVDSFGIASQVEEITGLLSDLQQVLGSNYSGNCYIAPPGVEVHCYWATGSLGRYKYNKLEAPTPIFEPSSEQRQVRMIHLSKDDDPHNLEARKGIERRKRLQHLVATLAHCTQALGEELERLREPFQTFPAPED
jgi:hypothetical protein